MNRARLKRRISPSENLGKNDECEDNVDLKRSHHLTESSLPGHETTKDKAVSLAAGNYEPQLIPGYNVAMSLAPIVNSGRTAVGNLLTCLRPLHSDGKVQKLDDTKIAQQFPKTGKHDSTNSLLNGIRQSQQHDFDSDVTELPAATFKTDKQMTCDGCAADQLCQICWNNNQRHMGHINRCIDELENADKEKKRHDVTTKHLWIEVLGCPICGRKLKTQNARHLHLKKCAVTFCISPIDLIELIKKQEQDQLQLLSSSLQEMSAELQRGKTNPGLIKKKQKRVMKNWFKEPHSKLEEDTQLAIALSTSIEDRRNSLADFVSYTLPPENKPKEEETENISAAVYGTLCPLPPHSKDALLLLMSQKTKQSSLSTKHGKKNKVEKQLAALLALDQDEVKQRLAEKATALVLEQPDFSVFYDAHVFCFPKSQLPAKYSCKRGQDFLWCLASQNMDNLCVYYVKELAPPVVPNPKDVGYSSTEQKHLHWQTSGERPEPQQLNQTLMSVLSGSTQTTLILAELAADAGTESSFADELFKKSLSSSQEIQKQPLPCAADATVAKGFCLATDEVCDKTSISLLNAWSQMVDNACMSDLTIECRDGEVIRLHRLVFMARYPNLLQIIESESSRVVFSRYSKMAVLSIVRFVYAADTDVHHLVVLEAKRLAESLQLADFCEICENVIKTYNLTESTAPEASAAALEELITCSWSDGLDQIQREKEELWGGSGKAVKKEEEEEEEKDAYLDEVYTFMLAQRRNQMNGGVFSEDNTDNESDTSKRIIEDNDECLIKTGSQSCSGSDDEDQDGMLLDLSQSTSVGEKLPIIVLSEESHKVKSYASYDSAVNLAEDVSVDAQIFPNAVLSEKECSSVHVELLADKVRKCSDSSLIHSVSENSNRTIDLVAAVNETEKCLCDDDDDENNVRRHKSSEEYVPGCFAAAELNHKKEDRREMSHLVDGSCLSLVLRTDPLTEYPPLDSNDFCSADSFEYNRKGEKEPVASYTSIVPLKSASSSSCCYSTRVFVPSSCDASGSSDTISKQAPGLISSCTISSDSPSPDLFPSSPFSDGIMSPVVSLQEPHVLLEAAKKLNNILDTDYVVRDELESGESMNECARNLTEGSERVTGRRNGDEYEKYRHNAMASKNNSDSSLYHKKSILEKPCHSVAHIFPFCQENLFDAEHHFLSQTAEKLTDEDFLPNLDDDDDDDVDYDEDTDKVQNPNETTCRQNSTSVVLNCNEKFVNKDMKSDNSEVEVSRCIDEVLFPHSMRTLHLSSGLEIGTETAEMYESFRNCVASHSKSLSSSRIDSPVMTYKLENSCQIPDNKTLEDIPNAEVNYKERSEKKRQLSLDDDADSTVSHGHHDVDDDGHDNKNTACISIQHDDEGSAARLDSNGRLCDEEKIWEDFPEEEFVPHVFFENDENASRTHLASTTPKSVKMQGHRTADRLKFSPPTDMETDVSAVMEDIIANSGLLNSDVSFETSRDAARIMVNAKSPIVNNVQQVNRSDIAGTSVLTVTPLPSYGLMNTPALQQRCHDYGIRCLPKKQMVRVLENIYFDLHPGTAKPDTVKPKQNARKRTKTEANKGNQASFVTCKRRSGYIATQQDNQNNQTTRQPAMVTSGKLHQGKSFLARQKTAEISVSSNSESDNYLEFDCPEQDSIDDEDEEDEEDGRLRRVPEESVLVQKQKKTKPDVKSKQDDSVKREILMSFFSKNTDLYQRILSYEPLELDYLKKLLKENEIKVASHFLIDFLDEQNLLFTTRNGRVGWNSRRLVAGQRKAHQSAIPSEQHF